jgi:hypothetical protein
MTSLAGLILTALTLGALHSFAPDHLAAVSVFVSRAPEWRRSMSLGARWGIGHSLTIMLVGGALSLTSIRLPARFSSAAEHVIGVVLIVLGFLAIRRASRIHGHRHHHDGHEHWHLHSHRTSADHEHAHRTLLGIGMLHGLAGTGALAAALPITLTSARALVFLTAFGVGTVASMASFSAVAGAGLRLATARSASLLRTISVVAGAASVGVGAWWAVAGGG